MHTYYGDFQWKLLRHLIYDVLRADPYVAKRVGNRIHPQHISTVENPIYPCITVIRQGLGGDPSIPQIDEAFLTLDVWSKKGVVELWEIYSNRDPITNNPAGIRSLLTNPHLGDFLEVSLDYCREMYVTDNLFEADTKTYHMAARYDLKFAGKTLIT